jgi:putative aldouronate transport system substrate-binding protein
LALALIAAQAFGAGQQEAATGEEGPIELSAVVTYGAVAENADQDDTYYMNYVEHTFNIVWDLTTIPNSAAQERLNILFAAGDMPDLFPGSAVGHIYSDAIRTGQFLALEDRIENGTGWINHPDWENIRPVITHTDGHIYTFTYGNSNMLSRNAGGRYYLNEKWLNEVGYEVPTTLDELTEGLVAISEAMPNKTVISGHWENFRVTDYFILAHGMNASGSMGDYLGNQINIVDGEVVFTVLHPNFRDYLEYTNSLWESGLIDQEYFSQQVAQLRAKGKDQGFALASDASFPLIFGNDEGIYDYVFTPPLLSDYNEALWWPEHTIYSIPNGAIPTASRHPDKAFEILDWMGTPDHVFLYDAQVSERLYVPELVPQGLSKENVVAQPVDGGEYYNRGNALEGMSSWEYMNTYMTNRSSGFPMILDRGADWWTEEFGLRPILKENLNQYLGWSVDRVVLPHFRKVVSGRDLKFLPEEQEILDSYAGELTDFIDENHAKFLIGARPISEYDEFLEELDRYRMDEIQEVYQASYERYLEVQ